MVHSNDRGTVNDLREDGKIVGSEICDSIKT